MNQKSFRPLLFGATFASLVLDAVLENLKDAAIETSTNFYVPFGTIAVFISLYLFYEYNRVRSAKRELRLEKINQHRQALLDNLFRAKSQQRLIKFL